MPELPEVETIVRELHAALPGRAIRDVQVFRADALGGVPVERFRAALRGGTFRGVTRRGKFLVFTLEPERYLVGHLRMTGKFAVTGPLPAPLPYHRAWFALDDGSLLVFQDLRCFGTLAVVERLADHAGLAALGVEPLSRRFTARWLGAALAASRTPLKHWLMDQSKLAGLGNIYAAEILYAARLAPTRTTQSLAAAEVTRLHAATRAILRKAIHKSGTTIRDFRRVDEQTGQFQNFLRVYGKAGQPCPACRTPIARLVQQQRSTFYCPRCQR
jgi:formamidopyrimidine-DNA glycosylase